MVENNEVGCLGRQFKRSGASWRRPASPDDFGDHCGQRDAAERTALQPRWPRSIGWLPVGLSKLLGIQMLVASFGARFVVFHVLPCFRGKYRRLVVAPCAHRVMRRCANDGDQISCAR